MPHLLQQASHGSGADADLQALQLLSNFLGYLAAPLQTAHRVTRCLMFYQFGDLLDDPRRLFSTVLRPPPT